MLSGIVPSKLFRKRSNIFKLGKLEKLTLLSSPLKLLLLRSMIMRFVQLVRVDGSSPYMLLWSKWNSSNLFSSPIESGTFPLILFPPRSRVTRFLSLLMPLSDPSN
ncbi:hypothetical protein PVAP13_1KG056254 [Panicum virgatum]|uniref:Uncharacterized protein n=1 Tax=Panicum virgatum TaxID=38727 RepID=A0A8T0XAL9_PANVG|nr:hypothetical protein PVAP13_1KG056254 [Panicum virgatum]